MKKLHKSLASLLAIAMLLTSVPFAALAAEEADIVAEAPVAEQQAPAVTTVALQNEPGELPIVGVLDGIVRLTAAEAGLPEGIIAGGMFQNFVEIGGFFVENRFGKIR